jgi:hypothetical protein
VHSKEGATLRIWPVIPWLFPDGLQEQFEIGWSTAVVGIPDDMSLPVSLSLELPGDLLDRVEDVWQQTMTGWDLYEFSLEEGRVVMTSPDTGTFILMLME